MKRTIAITLIAIFLFSLVPLAFAQRLNVDANAEIKSSVKADSGERLNRLSNLSRERLDKIQELDQRQKERLAQLEIKNLEKITELKKERLEKLAKLSEEKLKRLAELEKDKLEKISDLNESDINKLSVLGRARLKHMAELDMSKLKMELRTLKVVKVKNSADLSKRHVSNTNLTVFRERFEKAKEQFKEAKDELQEARKELKDARERGDENATIEHSKTYLLRFADALVNHLNKIKAKVQENENIEAELEAKIVAEIDAQIEEINKIKTEIEAATTKDQVKEAAKKLREKWNKLRHLIKIHTDRVILARVEGIVNQGLVLEKRLDHILEKAEEKDIEVDVKAEMESFSQKIATSREKYKQAQVKFSEIFDLMAKGEPADSEKIKDLREEANQLLKEARAALKEAHDILKEIVKKIKAADPKADLSAEVEVEVEEDSANLTAESNTSAST